MDSQTHYFIEATEEETTYSPVMNAANQASVSHRTKLPMIYDNKIANDMKIDGKLPKMPRILGSQLSPI